MANTLASIIIAAAVIGLVLWRRAGKSKRPVKGEGYRLLYPLVIIAVVYALSISQLLQIPGGAFQWPVPWEMLVAALLGVVFGTVMLYQTAYEKRDDGLIYPKTNKNLKYILIAIIVIRIALTQYFSGMNSGQFTILAMDMAFVYLCIWRIGSFVKFRRLKKSEEAEIAA